jgi:hypothetical protein
MLKPHRGDALIMSELIIAVVVIVGGVLLRIC